MHPAFIECLRISLPPQDLTFNCTLFTPSAGDSRRTTSDSGRPHISAGTASARDARASLSAAAGATCRTSASGGSSCPGHASCSCVTGGPSSPGGSGAGGSGGPGSSGGSRASSCGTGGDAFWRQDAQLRVRQMARQQVRACVKSPVVVMCD